MAGGILQQTYKVDLLILPLPELLLEEKLKVKTDGHWTIEHTINILAKLGYLKCPGLDWSAVQIGAPSNVGHAFSLQEQEN